MHASVALRTALIKSLFFNTSQFSWPYAKWHLHYMTCFIEHHYQRLHILPDCPVLPVIRNPALTCLSTNMFLTSSCNQIISITTAAFRPRILEHCTRKCLNSALFNKSITLGAGLGGGKSPSRKLNPNYDFGDSHRRTLKLK